jgi:hypothetical protein
VSAPAGGLGSADWDRVPAKRDAPPIFRHLDRRDRCAGGLSALQAYRREWDEATRTFKPRPLHDWSSHGADALRTFAMGFGDDSAPTAPPAYERSRRAGDGRGWRRSCVVRASRLDRFAIERLSMRGLEFSELAVDRVTAMSGSRAAARVVTGLSAVVKVQPILWMADRCPTSMEGWLGPWRGYRAGR